MLSGGGARGVAHIGVLKVLEEMHIPVDYVVGTSMGSIVVSAYAMGNDPKDLAARLEKVKWNEVLDDNPPRLARTTYTKANERNSISSRELGFRDAELQVPRGLNYGQQIEFFFNTLAARTGDIDHFDQLDIPYRAVATDIETGKMVVLERGAIARAMRASMSVPGVFAPVDIDGHALLDGGLVRNLPVDVARSMGADVIIAVNLGTALLKRDQITSVFGVGQQMLNILTEQNVEASLRQLTANRRADYARPRRIFGRRFRQRRQHHRHRRSLPRAPSRRSWLPWRSTTTRGRSTWPRARACHLPT
ncbi:patatin-like phospholipase family protein [Massilia sp. B-10]|nr:patatin-like phospholipase family protein [Massilia sp. B-10]